MIEDFENFPIQLARDSVVYFLTHKKYLPTPSEIPLPFQKKAAAFVTLKKAGELRGCIGTISPVMENVAEEIIRNAVSAALHDPRFPPVSLEEIPNIDFSVDVLEKPEPVSSLDELNPKIYGVIVRSGKKSALLLPDLEGIETPEEQVKIACRKGGIYPGEKIELQRFKVTRYGKK
jgi:AmmeMemoRadiSam system protein A